MFEKLIAIYSKKSPQQFLPESVKGIDATQLASEIFNSSKLTSYSGLKEVLSGDAKTVLERLNQDKGFAFVKTLAEAYNKNVAPKYDEINLKNMATQRTYMKAILELSPKSARIFPDANSTLRVTYGKVKGTSQAMQLCIRPLHI